MSTGWFENRLACPEFQCFILQCVPIPSGIACVHHRSGWPSRRSEDDDDELIWAPYALATRQAPAALVVPVLTRRTHPRREADWYSPEAAFGPVWSRNFAPCDCVLTHQETAHFALPKRQSCQFASSGLIACQPIGIQKTSIRRFRLRCRFISATNRLAGSSLPASSVEIGDRCSALLPPRHSPMAAVSHTAVHASNFADAHGAVSRQSFVRPVPRR